MALKIGWARIESREEICAVWSADVLLGVVADTVTIQDRFDGPDHIWEKTSIGRRIISLECCNCKGTVHFELSSWALIW